MSKRIDIVRLAKMSLDVELLKKHYFSQVQRRLFKKQRRHALNVDSAGASEVEGDSDPDCHIFMTDKDRSLLKTSLKSETDRSLLIGILDRKKDMIPKMATAERDWEQEDSEAESEDKSNTVIGPQKWRTKTDAKPPIRLVNYVQDDAILENLDDELKSKKQKKK